MSKDLRSLWSSQARGLLYKAKAKASGLYDICAQICHNFSHLKICIESSAVKDLWGISRFKFCRIFPIFMQIVGSFSRPMQWNGAWVEWMNIWGNWRQREGTGGVENVITKHGVGRSEDEMADKTSQRKHKYISLKTNICLIDTNISWTIQIVVGVQQNVMRKQEVVVGKMKWAIKALRWSVNSPVDSLMQPRNFYQMKYWPCCCLSLLEIEQYSEWKLVSIFSTN